MRILFLFIFDIVGLWLSCLNKFYFPSNIHVMIIPTGEHMKFRGVETQQSGDGTWLSDTWWSYWQEPSMALDSLDTILDLS